MQTTTSKLSLRVDCAVKPDSCVRAWLYSSLALVMIMLSGLAQLWLWQYVLTLIIAAAVISYLALSKPILLHLSQPPLSKRVDIGWQLLMRTSRADELWQANLSATYHFPWLIHLKLNMTEPYRRPFTVMIFRDQVSAEEWRQLSILAKSVGMTHEDTQIDSKLV